MQNTDYQRLSGLFLSWVFDLSEWSLQLQIYVVLPAWSWLQHLRRPLVERYIGRGPEALLLRLSILRLPISKDDFPERFHLLTLLAQLNLCHEDDYAKTLHNGHDPLGHWFGDGSSRP